MSPSSPAFTVSARGFEYDAVEPPLPPAPELPQPAQHRRSRLASSPAMNGMIDAYLSAHYPVFFSSGDITIYDLR